MLSLQRQRLSQAEHSEDSLPPRSLGEVFGSIENLRRVIQEITLEEIRDAEEKALLMVRRLSSLQAVCANFAVIRQFVIKVQRARLHALEENSGEPGKEIPQLYSRTSDKAPEDVIFSSGNARLTKAEIDAPFQKGAQEAPPPVTNNQPAAPNPTRKADEDPTTESTEDLPTTQVDDFTLGENQLGEDRFELGFSLARVGAEEKISALDNDRYAAIVLMPEEISPATFSFHQDPESTALPATPKDDGEMLPPGFLDQMITNFTAFVGPMSAVIVDEQVAHLGEAFTAFPRSRLDELIALLSREILDDPSKVRFQKQMAEKIRTLTSQAPSVSARKKND